MKEKYVFRLEMPLLSFIFLTFAPESGLFRFFFYVKITTIRKQ